MAPMASMAHQAPLTHSVAFLARRAATALAAVLVLGAAAAPAAYADSADAPSASPKKLPDGLYGSRTRSTTGSGGSRSRCWPRTPWACAPRRPP